jgi:hypothetical protein
MLIALTHRMGTRKKSSLSQTRQTVFDDIAGYKITIDNHGWADVQGD